MKNSNNDNVLIGVLNGKNSAAHLEWIKNTNSYYMPLLKSQPRQFKVDWLLLYVPKPIISPGAIRYKSLIDGLRITRRDEIETPWNTNQGPSKWQILYELATFEELNPPIYNKDHEGNEQRISQPRWTRRLAMDRARTINELLLESEADWWIYDNLKKRGVEFRIRARSSSKEEQKPSESRIWFFIPKKDFMIRYSGNSGFIMRNKYGVEKVYLYIENLLESCFGENLNEPEIRKDNLCAAGSPLQKK
jgi:uncharacterized protein